MKKNNVNNTNNEEMATVEKKTLKERLQDKKDQFREEHPEAAEKFENIKMKSKKACEVVGAVVIGGAVAAGTVALAALATKGRRNQTEESDDDSIEVEAYDVEDEFDFESEDFEDSETETTDEVEDSENSTEE